MAEKLEKVENEPLLYRRERLRVRRAEKADRENPFTHIHDGLKSFMKAHRAWLKLRYPKSRKYYMGLVTPEAATAWFSL